MSKKEDNKLQTEFNITDENYEAYEKLSRIKNGVFSESEWKTMIKICVTLIVGTFALIGSATFGVLNLIRILNLAKTEIAASVWAVSAVGFDVASFIAACFITTKIAKKIRMKKFEKLNPNVNTFVDVEALEKELTKYKELKTLPNNIKEKKEQYITNHKDEFREKTTDEKINELKKEIEFWEQVKIEEKYRDDSTKDNAKVLKKTYNLNNK